MISHRGKSLRMFKVFLVALILPMVLACEEMVTEDKTSLMTASAVGKDIREIVPIAGVEAGSDEPDEDETGTTTRTSHCVLTAETLNVTFPIAGGNGTLYVNASDVDGCNWDGAGPKGRLETDDAWITGDRFAFIGAESGMENGEVINGTRYYYKAGFTVAAHNGATSRSGEVWAIQERDGSGATSARTTVKQERVEHAPTVELKCRVEGVEGDCPSEVDALGQSIRLVAKAADLNNDDLRYSWEKTGGSWNVVGGPESDWIQPRTTGVYTIRVTVEEAEDITSLATASVDLEVVGCPITVDGNSHIGSSGFSGYLDGGGTGKLRFRKGDSEFCIFPKLAEHFSARVPGTDGDTPGAIIDWITFSNTVKFNDPFFTHYTEYTVKRNTTYESRAAEIGSRYVNWNRSNGFIWVGQAGMKRAPTAPSCPATRITHSRTSWKVGDRYYGSGFTHPWAKMGYGEPGGCRANGLLLSQPGRMRICGYNVEDAAAREACRSASRAPVATYSTDPTYGKIEYVDSNGAYTDTATGNTPAAQWIEFLVQEAVPDQGMLTLAVGTSDSGIYLHFGYEHESDLSYGDSEYGRWGVGEPTWTFSPVSSSTVSYPTITKASYPGVFHVDCAATNGRPTNGFTVTASVMRSGTSYTVSADHTNPEPKYPRICQPE